LPEIAGSATPNAAREFHIKPLARTALAAQKQPARRSRYAVRWLRRLLEEDDNLTIEEATLAVSALAALGSRAHAEALSTLSAVAERATRQPTSRRLARRSG
jgi:hypothetical protein